MRRTLWIAALLALSACGDKQPKGEALYDFTQEVQGGPKAMIYNLVGRWYPVEEVKRLEKLGITPADWCKRPISRLELTMDSVELQCDSGVIERAVVANIGPAQGGGIDLKLRASSDAQLNELTFKTVVGSARGTEATILGLPCYGGKLHVYARFPRYEVLRRQVLGGRSCDQIGQAAP